MAAPDPIPRAPAAPRAPRFDVERIRADFPILGQKIHGRPLVYLDNAASSQKPRQVLRAVEDCYTRYYSNIHRGVHSLSEASTAAYEGARDKARRFLNAADRREIVFVRGATEAVNLVAQAWGRANLRPGDEILISTMEHHSNLVPWQMLCGEAGARLRVAPIDDAGELILEEFDRLLGPRTRLVAIAHVSNSLGTINPVQEIVRRAHARGVPVLLDGAQAAPHLRVDVQAIGCDFYALSGHKMYGPSGIGVLYGRRAFLEGMPPWQGGGDMIASVTFEKTIYNVPPHRFEAGTQNIGGAIGLGAAIDYLDEIDLDAAGAWEAELLEYATAAVAEIPGLRVIGTARHKAGILSFVLDGVHPHDVGTVLDREGIAVRTGHHCTQPLMDRFRVPATVRASFGIYNTKGEVDALVRGLRRVREVFR